MSQADEDPVRWLYGLQTFGVKLGLDAIRVLLDLLGHPEAGFASILIGGTNGKGSVAAMVDAILVASGVRAGLFTSPHLVRPNERIRIVGKDIADAAFHRHLIEVRDAAARALSSGLLPTHPSFFEVMTATALSAFREAGVQAAVLEVGLGGRLDATNAVPADVAAIVSVDLDHTDRLGSTRAVIAAEKTGIVKPGKPLVTGVASSGLEEEEDEALVVLRWACQKAGAPLVEAARTTVLTPGDDGTVTVKTDRALYPDLRLSLAGDHQLENLRVALLAYERLAERLGIALDPAAVRRGLAQVRWPGRLQWIEGKPPMLLDGAHNPAAAAALAHFLRDRGGPPPVLLFAAMREKNVGGILRPLRGLVGPVVLTRPRVDRAAEPQALLSAAEQALHPAPAEGGPADPAANFPIVVEPAVPEALKLAQALAHDGQFVLVTGSLYLVGEVLGVLEGGEVPGPVPM